MHDFEFLLGKAAQVVSEAFRDTRLCHARGTPTNPTAVAISDFTQWGFAFLLPRDYVTIMWNVDRFDPPQKHSGLWLNDQPIEPPLLKTFASAFDILCGAGYPDGITQVDLRKPLYPGVTEPYYQFAFGNPVSRVIAVGANTGTVKTE